MLHKRLAQETAAYQKQWLILFCCSTASAIGTVYTAYCLAAIIDGVFLHSRTLLDSMPFFKSALGVLCLRTIAVWYKETSAHTIAENIKNDLRRKLLRRLAARGPIALAREQTGELIALLTDGIEQLDGYFSKLLPQCISAAAALMTILTVVLALDPLTAALLVITVPLIPIFMFLIGKRADRANLTQWKTLSALNARLFDLMEGLTTLKLFGQSRAQARQIEQLGNHFHDAVLKVLRVAFLSSFVLELAATLSIAVIAVTIGLRLLDGRIDFMRSFFLLLVAPSFYQPLRQLGSAFHSAASGIAAAERLDHFLIPAEEAAAPQPSATDYIPQTAISIRFDDVYFSYEKERGNALRGLCLTIEAGKRTAIVGMSGAGKTTLLALLLQLIRPAQGNIRINDRDLTDIPPELWRRNVAYLPQTPHIFCLSAAENIALAKPGASMDEIVRAAKDADAHSWIESLPDGYRTQLGAGGRKLSGGQSQRIAIARAFLQSAPLILLDEAMTGLDSETEASVEAALLKLSAGRTLITIVHRLYTIKNADKIIVLENGQAVESGTHNDLRAKQGSYAALLAAERGTSCAFF